ncbi:MAG: hypothetical protein C0445_01885 [Polaromonas sp.]|nr:hypothetical protein [Polaromonas sp.]
MGLMDSLLGAAAQAASGGMQNTSGMAGGQGMDAMGMVGELLQQSGGLSGILEKFQGQGMGEAAQSWVGTGANMPLSANQVTQAFGPDTLQLLAAKFGGNSPQIAQLVAQFLPMLIDQLTPQGQVPADNGAGGLGNLGSLAGLAEQFLKGR